MLLLLQAPALFGGYRTQTHIDRIQKIIVSGNFNDLWSYASNLQILYILIGVAFLIFFGTIAVCCTFDSTCPPCKSLKRDFAKRPYNKS
jgi:hypothetical protein